MLALSAGDAGSTPATGLMNPFTGDEMQEFHRFLGRMRYPASKPFAWFAHQSFLDRAKATCLKLDGGHLYTSDRGMQAGFDHFLFLGCVMIPLQDDYGSLFHVACVIHHGFTPIMYPFGEIK
jgi:hypothetical protein